MSYIQTGRRVHERVRLIERHHAFWGLIGMLLGFAGIVYAPFLAGLFSIGIVPMLIILFIWIAFWMWVFVDDCVQHAVQVAQYDALGYYDKYTFWHYFPYDVLGWIKGKR